MLRCLGACEVPCILRQRYYMYYIYIYIERERDLYMQIERERERERKRGRISVITIHNISSLQVRCWPEPDPKQMLDLSKPADSVRGNVTSYETVFDSGGQTAVDIFGAAVPAALPPEGNIIIPQLSGDLPSVGGSCTYMTLLLSLLMLLLLLLLSSLVTVSVHSPSSLPSVFRFPLSTSQPILLRSVAIRRPRNTTRGVSATIAEIRTTCGPRLV